MKVKTSFNKIGNKRIWDFGRVTFYHRRENKRDFYTVYHWDEKGFATHHEILNRKTFSERLIPALRKREREPFLVWG